MNLLPDISKIVESSIVENFAEIHQPRSNFQLEKFVVNAHPTRQMQYHQIITEIQALYYTIKNVSLELQKTEIQIARLRSSGDDIDEIEAQIKELQIEQTRIVGVGAFRELDTLLRLKSNYPEYTRNEIEENQQEYWQLRLEQQQVNPNQQAINQIYTKSKEIE